MSVVAAIRHENIFYAPVSLWLIRRQIACTCVCAYESVGPRFALFSGHANSPFFLRFSLLLDVGFILAEMSERSRIERPVYSGAPLCSYKDDCRGMK